MTYDPDYWQNQRFEDDYFDLHGHFLGQDDSDCSLCKEL